MCNHAPPQPASALQMMDDMLGYLRGQNPIVAHEIAKAMIGSAATILRERFGTVHAIATAQMIVDAVEVDGLPSEQPERPLARVVLH